MDKKELIAAVKKMDTASISDACDKLGIPCGLLGVQAVVEGKRSAARLSPFTTFLAELKREQSEILLTMLSRDRLS